MVCNARQRRRATERAAGKLESAEARAHVLWVALRQLVHALSDHLPEGDRGRLRRAVNDVESCKFRLQRLKIDAEARLQKSGLHVSDGHKLRTEGET